MASTANTSTPSTTIKYFELDMYGWELLYKLTEREMKCKPDVLVAIAHWVLTRRGFRCAGVGEDTAIPRSECQSELLPAGWNVSPTYRLRYVHENRMHLFSAIITGDDVIMNLNRLQDELLGAVVLKTTEVAQLNGTLKQMVPNYERIVETIREELMESILKVVLSKEAQCQTDELYEDRRRITDPNPEPPTPERPQRILHYGGPMRPHVSVEGVGRSDLDPLGIGAPRGGGMLFNPPGMGPRPSPHRPDPSLPFGSVPPGARFDPIRPQGPGGMRPPRPGRHPDHDHMPPPGYDDMFM